MKSRVMFRWLALALFVTLAGCSDDETIGDGSERGAAVDHSTPEKVAESFGRSLVRRDWKNALACVTEDTQGELTAGLAIDVIDAARSGKGAEGTSAINLVNKHGIQVGSTKPRFNDIKDKVAFINEAIEWAKRHSSADKPKYADRKIDARFSNFQTRGRAATAEMVLDAKPNTIEVIFFKKIGGNWYVDLHETANGNRERADRSSGPQKLTTVRTKPLVPDSSQNRPAEENPRSDKNVRGEALVVISVAKLRCRNGAAVPGSTITVRCELAVVVDETDLAAVQKRLTNSPRRANAAVESVLQKASFADLNDPKQAEIRGGLKRELNRFFKEEFVVRIIFTEWQILKQ
ncbi:MAG: hypothetical protein IID45_11155 [Planctomycetes bacterium]|nr:hypothetical protein [Planctomycetota bacterium]